MNIAILTSTTSWFIPHAHRLSKKLCRMGYVCDVFHRYEDIPERFETVFILSYFRVIPEKLLQKHQYNLVVHESALPKGKGWAPLFWQILEHKNQIPIVLFEADGEIDHGPIYIKDTVALKGYELHNEIRKKQAKKTIELCVRFVKNRETMKPHIQKGTETSYEKRQPEDSRLNIRKSIKSQFNLLRIVDNNEFPAFFDYKNHRYIIKVYRQSP